MLVAILAATLISGYDYALTLRRYRKYGIGVELNPAVSYLIRNVGLQNGLLSWTLVPHALFSYICWTYDWRIGYAFYFGYLVRYWLLQLASLSLEREIDRQAAEPKL